MPEHVSNIITVKGVDYEIDWDSIKVGDSFFIPCVDTPGLNRAMSHKAKQLKWEITFDIRDEAGKWGVRYWRLV